jgi:hypothetical protein
MVIPLYNNNWGIVMPDADILPTTVTEHRFSGLGEYHYMDTLSIVALK